MIQDTNNATSEKWSQYKTNSNNNNNNNNKNNYNKISCNTINELLDALPHSSNTQDEKESTEDVWWENKDALSHLPLKLQQKIAESLKIINEAFDRYKTKETEIGFSFNGGKDSTVLLHLLRCGIAKRRSVAPEYTLSSLVTFHFEMDEFEEMEHFMKQQQQKYHFMAAPFNQGFKQGLEQLKQRYNLAAVFLGTRRADPDGHNLSAFAPTTEGWPDMVRVCPLLEWNYADIWTFLKTMDMPYCELYDRGYTSLGRRSTTQPNPVLQRAPGEYLPAYELHDESLERKGRC